MNLASIMIPTAGMNIMENTGFANADKKSITDSKIPVFAFEREKNIVFLEADPSDKAHQSVMSMKQISAKGRAAV